MMEGVRDRITVRKTSNSKLTLTTRDKAVHDVIEL